MATSTLDRDGWRQLSCVAVLALTAISATAANGQEMRQPVLDGQSRLDWFAHHQQMVEESPYQEYEWQFIGPELMCGRVTDIAIAPDQPYTYFVSTASGGVWKTENEGTTWQPLFADNPTASIGTIAIAPSRTDDVWVGLGEANIFRSSMAGLGVYVSRDGGETFLHRGLTDTGHIARIVIHPDDPDTVYVAASGHEYRANEERGIYRTRDGGENWERVMYIADHIGAIDLVMAPDDPQTLYAAMWNRTRRAWSDPLPGPDDGIFKSTDGGETWVQLTDGLPDSADLGRIGLAVTAANPDVVYAVIDNHEMAREADDGERDNYGRRRGNVIKGAEVWRSDDRGETWRVMSEGDEAMARVFATYGWVFGQIRVDPTDEDRLFVLGVSLLQSTDGGKSFENCRFPGLHADHHALWINPQNPRHIVNGNDGGINFSYDGGATWKNVENLPVVQFYNVEVDNAQPFRVYGSIQDNHSWRGPSDYRPGRSEKSDWHRIPGGEASTMAIDPDDENNFYSAGFYGRIQRSTFEPPDTTVIVPEAAEGEPPLRGQWLAPFLLSPHNSGVVYHGMQYVYRSMNRGETWERISDDLTAYAPERQGNISFSTISSLDESPLKFGLVYAGTDDGRLHVTRNGGLAWKEIGRNLPTKWVSRVEASRFNEATVFVTLNGKRDDDFQVYVYRSDDYGDTWTDIGEGIPGGPVNVILEDPEHADVLYVGTDTGAYISTDQGATWDVLGSGLPVTFVHDFAIQERDKTLVAATHGRGIWKLRLRRVYMAIDRTREPADETEKGDSAGQGDDAQASEADDDSDANDDDGGSDDRQ